MHLHWPSIILVPDTSFSSADVSASSTRRRASRRTSILLQYIREEFPWTPIEPVARKYWNDRAGVLFLPQIDFPYRLEPTGTDFIAQLGVNDDELPATLVAASQKSYMHICPD